MTETTIYDFHTSFYILDIQNLAFHLPRVHILGTNHCGAMQHRSFKRIELFQDILRICYYAERVVAIFAHQIQSEYYVGNRSVSIEGIALEHSSESTKSDINLTTPSRQRHEVFDYFLSDNSKQVSANTTTHSKHFISLIKEKKLTASLSTIWENTDGCAKQYRFASALYLMSVMSQC